MTAGKQDVMCLLEWEVGPSVKALACDLKPFFCRAIGPLGLALSFFKPHSPSVIWPILTLPYALSVCAVTKDTYKHRSASYSCSILFEILEQVSCI